MSVSYSGAGESQLTTAGSTNYTYSQAGLTTVTDGSGTTCLTTTPDGQTLSQTTPSGTYDYLQDGHGSTTGLADSSGSLAYQASYDPACVTSHSSGSAAPYVACFHQQVILNTGFYQTNSGVYDPETVQASQGAALLARVDEGGGGDDGAGGGCCAGGLGGGGDVLADGSITRNPQLKQLSPQEVQYIRRRTNVSAEQLKREYGCHPASRCDLYKDNAQWVYVAPKNNPDLAQRTWVNLDELYYAGGGNAVTETEVPAPLG